MPARTITMTKNDEDVFLPDKNEPDNGVISQKNTSFTSSTTNKKFSSLSKTNNIVDSLKTFFNFMSTSNNIRKEKADTADTNQIRDSLDESQALLRATDKFEFEPSAIDKTQHATEFLSDHEKIANLLHTSGLSLESPKTFIVRE